MGSGLDNCGTLKEMSQHFPVMVGEWCLDPASPKVLTLTQVATLERQRLKSWLVLQSPPTRTD